MNLEQHKPTPEESKKIEDMMTPERRAMSETREESFKTRETKEKLLAEYQKACEEFSELGLKVEDGEYHQKIIDSEGRPVWGINYPVEGYLREKGKGIDEFRKAAKLEIEIRELRDKNLQRVIGLNDSALNNNAGKIIPQNWEGWEAGQYSKNQSEYYALSHSLYFDKTYQWTEPDINDLDKNVKGKTSEIGTKNQTALEELQKIKIAGASVKIDRSNNSAIIVDEQTITFPTAENAKVAESWALENGAYLSHHHALGEQFRDRAKSENWDERKTSIALKIISGSIPEEKDHSVQAQHMMWGKGTGQFYTTSAKGWFVDNIQLGYSAGNLKDSNNELMFALKLFSEINPTVATAHEQHPLDFDTASHEDLETYAKKLMNERKLQEKREEMRKMKVGIKIYESESRTKGKFITEAEGLFSEVISEALKKNYGNPRRGYVVSVTRLLDTGKEGRKFSQRFSSGSEVAEYLKKFDQESLI